MRAKKVKFGKVLEVQNYTELRQKAFEKAKFSIWVNAYKDYILDNSGEILDFCSEKDIGILDNYIKKIRVGYKFAMITVNPGEDISLDLFREKIRKCLNKCWIGEFMYVFEQRGFTLETIGTGVHVHILIEIKKYKRPSDVRREVYNTFKNIVGNKQHVNIKFAMNFKNFKNYVLGIKKDIDNKKSLMMEIDKIWREQLRIKNVIISKPEFFEN